MQVAQSVCDRPSYMVHRGWRYSVYKAKPSLAPRTPDARSNQAQNGDSCGVRVALRYDHGLFVVAGSRLPLLSLSPTINISNTDLAPQAAEMTAMQANGRQLAHEKKRGVSMTQASEREKRGIGNNSWAQRNRSKRY
jgi:hypothetical protein